MTAFKKVLRESSGSASSAIETKQQVEYLDSYFSTIQPATMVVEQEYVDRDYLEDYSSYYVRCFSSYPRFCKRIHFFSKPFTEEDFFNILRAEASEITIQDLQDSFLGFIVVKPLPLSVVGRTCLKTFDGNGERFYPINRTYVAHLCGIELKVESLAFQEQDSVAGACATTALWSAFHATSRKFQHSLPSPFEITKAAASIRQTAARTFPSSGLTVPEMGQAIRSVGLEPHVFASSDEITIRSAIYSYLSAGIPILLAVELWDTEPPAPVSLGGHAVAITGFGVRTSPAVPMGPTGMLDESNRINRIYAHDDGLGPFARMELDGKNVVTKRNANDPEEYSLATTWKNPNNSKGFIRAVPQIMLVPVYHKIRIPMRKVHNEITQLDRWIEGFRGIGLLPSLAARLNWDIRLSTGNDVKAAIVSSSAISPEIKVKVLTTSLPRFLGKAVACCSGSTVAEFYFDLTGIDQGVAFLLAIPHNKEFSENLKTLASEPQVEAAISPTPAWNIFNWFKNC
ncbi:hypothetical protein [Geothrix sp. 21YS21S-2]|uniref:hypothetical protein n=1 Tax=Geothrix sp. 21YS21S-2 TaxID=3068893 RepID=UPI0027BAD386|nr:hypothetical protein [Geothrix sp. 21YS21S-2]